MRTLTLQEDYIIDGVDLLSGIGGTVGFWLGWSVLSSGHFVIHCVRSFIALGIAKIK